MINDNKTSKYLLYALGEIILVVIGILIALQVNEWNIERNRQKAEQVIIDQLITDLSSSQHDLERQRMFNLNRARRYSQVLRAFWKSELPDNIQDFLGGSASNVYSPVLGTAHSLINSGRLDIMSSKELKNDIVAYVEQVDYTLKDINRYEESYFRKGTELMIDVNPYNIESKEEINKRSESARSSWSYELNVNSRPPEVDRVPFKSDLKQLFEDERFYKGNSKLHLYHRNISWRYLELLGSTNKLLVELYKASNKHSNLGDLLSDSQHYLVFEPRDLEILQRVDELLSDPSKWDKSEDSECDADSTSEGFSLFCALRTATVENGGEWDRDKLSPAHRMLLFTIGKHEDRRVIENRLKDWNNHPDTSFEEVQKVLRECIEIVEAQIEARES
jgi:hypothetical protein